MREMRRLGVTVGAIAMAVVGTQIAHAVAYRIVEPSAEERAHLLAGTGHAYLRHASMALALLAVLAVLALVAEVCATAARGPVLAPRLWMFAVVAPATFVVQEHFERWFHDGAFPWGAALHATFAVGLLLQLPFALAAYLLARLLLGVTIALARLLRRERPSRRPIRSAWPRARAALLCSEPQRLGLGPRGPPLLSV
jgi:apolipoprotein N-acyltransferase